VRRPQRSRTDLLTRTYPSKQRSNHWRRTAATRELARTEMNPCRHVRLGPHGRHTRSAVDSRSHWDTVLWEVELAIVPEQEAELEKGLQRQHTGVPSELGSSWAVEPVLEHTGVVSPAEKGSEEPGCETELGSPRGLHPDRSHNACRNVGEVGSYRIHSSHRSASWLWHARSQQVQIRTGMCRTQPGAKHRWVDLWQSAHAHRTESGRRGTTTAANSSVGWWRSISPLLRPGEWMRVWVAFRVQQVAECSNTSAPFAQLGEEERAPSLRAS
jgi:hypothetical protein